MLNVNRNAAHSQNRTRFFLDKLFRHSACEAALTLLLMVNLLVLIIDTDYGAMGKSPPMWVPLVARTILGVFVSEITLRIYTYKRVFFRSKMNILDFVIVYFDALGEAIAWVMTESLDMSIHFTWLRCIRLLRLIRVVRAVRILRELSFMVRGLAGAMRAIVWAGALLFFMLTFWSIIAVQVLHPLNQDVTHTGHYREIGCLRCEYAFRSVMQANLTFVQQIIAGDSWGMVSIPIIEMYPWTATLFLAILLSVNLGVMNLILTCIVDQAMEARASDRAFQLENKKAMFEKACKDLLRICKDLDTDGSGFLSKQELAQGYDDNAAFASAMLLMDIRKEELDVVFRMMDTDRSGTVGYEEFVRQLHTMQEQNAQTVLSFIKYYVAELRHDVASEIRLVKDEIADRHVAHKELLEEIHQLQTSVFEGHTVDACRELPNGTRLPTMESHSAGPKLTTQGLLKLRASLEACMERLRQHVDKACSSLLEDAMFSMLSLEQAVSHLSASEHSRLHFVRAEGPLHQAKANMYLQKPPLEASSRSLDTSRSGNSSSHAASHEDQIEVKKAPLGAQHQLRVLAYNEEISKDQIGNLDLSF